MENLKRYFSKRNKNLFAVVMIMFMSFTFLSPVKAYAETKAWQLVGSAGFSGLEYISIEIAPDGKPCVAYNASEYPHSVELKIYNGSNWETIGKTVESGIQGGWINKKQAITINPQIYIMGKPSITSSETIVQKYTGYFPDSGIWETVGSEFDTMDNFSIKIDASGTPYIAYRIEDGFGKGSFRVQKYNEESSNWETVGSELSATDVPSMAIDRSGTPYVVYKDWANGRKATVLKYNGSNWDIVGSKGFSTGPVYLPSIAIDGSGTPYVVYQDDTEGTTTTVMKFNGSSWETVGSKLSDACIPSITIDESGTPYVAYVDRVSQKATVMKYDELAAQTYTLTFDSKGGSAVTEISDLAAGASITLPTAPTRSGYTFDGWYTNSGCTTLFDESNGISEDTTVYAKWILNNNQPLAVTVESVGKLNDISVENGTSIDDIELPETIEVTLSNEPEYSQSMMSINGAINSTTSAAVTWDNGEPEYDGDTAGTYTFTGTLELPDGVTNPDNLKASVDVIVKGADDDSDSSNSLVILATGSLGTAGDRKIAELETGKKYKLTVDGSKKYVKADGTLSDSERDVAALSGTEISGLTNGKTYYVEVYKPKSSSSSSGSSSSSSSSSSNSSSEQIKVKVTDGSSNNSIAQTIIERTTASDGTKKDTVTYTADKARETIAALAREGKDTARIVATDSNTQVSETKINIPKNTLSALSSGNVNLEIETNGAIISIPKESVQGLAQSGQLNGDLYFRVVPIKDEVKQTEIKTTANQQAVVRAVSGNNGVQVLGTPMTIETNISQRAVDIVLPLTGITLPSDATERQAFLNDLGVFIEHSDGEKVLEKGEVVEYAAGVFGMKFTVNKFSDFTIVKLNQDKAGWKQVDGTWYFINDNASMATGWMKSNNKWYLLKENGAMVTGWQQVHGKWYYLNADGDMATGWVQTNGKWYYLYSDGAMASNTIIEGYTLGASGEWIN